MCTGKCALCVGTGLYPLAVISIICNIILFFPGWDVKYAQNQQITEEVKYMGGLVGGGILVSLTLFNCKQSNVELYKNSNSIYAPYDNIYCIDMILSLVWSWSVTCFYK